MKSMILACAVGLLAATPLLTGSQDVSPSREPPTAILGSKGALSNGMVDMEECISFGRDIFASMDSDQSSKLDFDEFKAWEFSFIAEDEGQQRAYRAALTGT